MKTTIKDVAKKANVSAATVSLVINNNERISPSTRAKVLKAIKTLNYHPNLNARGLVSKRTGNIGFILREDHFTRREPFYTKIFMGSEFQANNGKYYLLLTTVPATFRNDDALPRFVLERNVDGIIIAGKVPQELVTGLVEYNIPLVFVDYYPPEGDSPVVMIDNITGVIKVMKYLSELGHRRIAFIGGDIEHPSIYERFQGYKMGLDKAGIAFDPQLTITDEPLPIPTCGYNAARTLLNLSSDFTAIVACNDAMAIGAMQYLQEQQIRIPEDVSLVGFDDVDTDLNRNPRLTTVSVPEDDMGVLAMRLMDEIVRGETNLRRRIVVPVELIVRGSTASPKQ